jgi:hypothetical protein
MQGPLDIVSVTAVPGCTAAPAAGLWLIIFPSAAVLLQDKTVLQARPALVIAEHDDASGTATSASATVTDHVKASAAGQCLNIILKVTVYVPGVEF